MRERAHRHLAIALAIGAAALVGACGDGYDENENADTTAATSTGALDSARGGGAGAAMTDAQIFGFTNMVDQAEVEAGELARTKGQNAQVKQYAQKMVTEHGQHMRQAGQLAQQVSANPEEPRSDQLAQQHQQLMSSLRDASGAQFDSLYITGMVQEHQGALDRLNQAMNDTQNQQVREFLNTTRQAVQQHLEQAQQIQGRLSGSANAGGGR